MRVEHFDRDADATAITAALSRDAVVVIDDLAPGATMDQVQEELAPYIEATAPGSDDFSGRNTKRTGGLIARSVTCRELVTHPTVVGVVGGLLSDSTSFRVHLTQIIGIGPGQPPQPIHRDQWAFDFFPFPAGYEVQCNTIWAMTDFTESNGATRVIPGSNAFEDHQRFTFDDTVAAEMTKGSVLFYTGSLYHGGGTNRTDSVRQGVNITYARGWLRQEENQYLSVPQEIARTLDDDLLRLIGYNRGAYALGYVDDLRDPLAVLKGIDDGHGHGLGDTERMAERVAESFDA